MQHVLISRLISRRRNQFTLAAHSTRLAAGLLVLLLAICGSNSVQADFSGNGDIVGTVDNAGNTTSPGDLIIGDTGTAGVFGDGALPLVGGDLNPLRSDLTIIGNEERSLGAVTLEDFLFIDPGTEPRGGNWIIDEELAVGNNGQGYLDLLNSARVEVADDTWIGGSTGTGALQTATGEGYGLVTINGAGTRLVTGDGLTKGFFIGFNGVGDVEVSGRASIESLGFAVIGEEDLADGKVTLTDRGTRWTIDSDLTIGNSRAGTTTAHGTLVINNEARVLVKDDVDINSRGHLQLGGGIFEVLTPASNTITNRGKITGSGILQGQLTITATGELRNAAGVANDREYLLVTDTVANAGLIESIGGEMEFEDVVTNTNDIIARDSILRFRGSEVSGSATDLNNTGQLVLGGDTTVYGNISGAGRIVSVKNTDLTGQPAIFGNVIFTEPGTVIAAVSDGGLAAATSPVEVGFDISGIGNDVGLSIFGDVDLAGVASLSIGIDPEVNTEIGDVVQVLAVSGNISGDFANEQLVADGYLWGIDIVGGEVLVTAESLFSGVAGDFDGDFDIDGSDFLAWQRGSATASGLSDWQEGFNPGGNLSAATGAVPEPSTLVLALLTLVCCPRRRRLS